MLKFMATFFAKQEVWISKDLEIPTETDGFEFKKKVEIKGVIAFGDRYPLANRDLSIKEHLMVWDAIKSTKSVGVVFDNIDGEKKMYMSNNGETQFV